MFAVWLLLNNTLDPAQLALGAALATRGSWSLGTIPPGQQHRAS
jgi:multisubunit Na+/H+ antiporter MnhE subunit